MSRHYNECTRTLGVAPTTTPTTSRQLLEGPLAQPTAMDMAMSEPYLVAHVVRGEAAFDVAERMDCPVCAIQFDDGVCDSPGCPECDGEGYWWIIPTSGHRAYPWAWTLIEFCKDRLAPGMFDPPPSGWPDHYKHGAAPKIDIKSLFKSEPKSYMPRRL